MSLDEKKPKPIRSKSFQNGISNTTNQNDTHFGGGIDMREMDEVAFITDLCCRF